MKKLTLLMISLPLLALSLNAAQHTVTNSGTTFSPKEITINTGDDIVFTLGSMHDAVEVSKETYDANGNTSNGGFSVPFGGGTVHFTEAGTYYYVCEPHAAVGMKGIIHVVAATNITSALSEPKLNVFPNPASESVSISYTLTNQSPVEISMMNITGSEVLSIINEFQNTGLHTLSYAFDKQLAPGVYFIKFMSAEGDLVKKILIE
jgi:plastocyanin